MEYHLKYYKRNLEFEFHRIDKFLQKEVKFSSFLNKIGIKTEIIKDFDKCKQEIEEKLNENLQFPIYELPACFEHYGRLNKNKSLWIVEGDPQYKGFPILKADIVKESMDYSIYFKNTSINFQYEAVAPNNPFKRKNFLVYSKKEGLATNYYKETVWATEEEARMERKKIIDEVRRAFDEYENPIGGNKPDEYPAA